MSGSLLFLMILVAVVSARSAGGHEGPEGSTDPIPPPLRGGGEYEFRNFVHNYIPITRRFELDASQVSDAIEECQRKFKNCTVISGESREEQYLQELESQREKRLSECHEKQESHWKKVYERNQNAWFYDIRKYTARFDEPEFEPQCQKEKWVQTVTNLGLAVIHAHGLKDVIEITH